MHAVRRHRGWVTTWLIAALLFMQLAVAAHACMQPAPATAQAAVPDCPHHRAAAPEPEREHSPLCKAHCESGLQSVNTQAGALDAPSVLAVPAALVGDVAVAPAANTVARPEALAAGPPPGAPPIYLTYLVLRN